jgi:ATP-dependent Clp protease ATP-binding subunit ClpA
MGNKCELDPVLESRLKRMRLRLETPDEDTLAVKDVPASRQCFSKGRTNLLIKRPVQGQPCFLCVDEDLFYTGADQTLARVFASAPTRQGWRILSFGGALPANLGSALEYAVAMLESGAADLPKIENGKPALKGLLASWAKDLSLESESTHTPVTLFRDEELEQAGGCTLGWQGRLGLVLGESGTGKTNLMGGVARILRPLNRHLLGVNAGALMAGILFESERERLLQTLLTEAREEGVVLAVEQGEWLTIGVPRYAAILCDALDRGSRLLATAAPEHEHRFAVAPLISRLETVRLSELCANDSLQVLQALRPSLAAHHRVRIDADVERAAVDRARALPGALPGKAIKLLDAAAARARLNHCESVLLIDVFMAASRIIPEET